MTKQMMIDNYTFGCVFFVSILGIVGISWLIDLAAIASMDLWLNAFKLKSLLIEFLTWKNSEEGQKTRDRLLSRTQKSDNS